MRSTVILVSVGLQLALLAAASPAAPPAGGAAVALDLGESIWRHQLVRETPEFLTAADKIEKIVYRPKNSQVFRTKQLLGPDDYTVEKGAEYRLPVDLSPDWMKPDFDDSHWARACGAPAVEIDEGLKQICARGSFHVADPAACGELTLSAGYRGGLVVYLNGQEVARKDMMKGHELGAPYPESAFLNDKGMMLETGKELSRTKAFDRTLADCRIPASKLRKGLNVLAVSVYRSPLDKVCMLRPIAGNRCFVLGWIGLPIGISPIGVSQLKLTVANGAGISPAAVDGLTVWNQSITQNVFGVDNGQSAGPLRPVRMAAPRGGVGTGIVVVAAPAELKNLKVQAVELKSAAGSIPASRVEVRFPKLDGYGPAPVRQSRGPTTFDTLAEAPPTTVAVNQESRLAIQPVFITVNVPVDVAPGEYGGELKVSSDGGAAQAVSLRLIVSAWRLPGAGDRVTHNDFMQSPESVAMRYGVELWSNEHMKLLDVTFSRLAPLSLKTLYVTAVRRTHLGNEHAMVRWHRGSEGQLEPDLSIVEKYIDVARKHLGPIPSVVLYAWEAPDTMGHAGNPGAASRTHDRPILLTLVNRKTGELREILGPDWGTPECRELWGKLVKAMNKLLADRGMAKSLLIGLLGDHRATKMAMDEMSGGDKNVLFACHSHMYCDTHQGYKVAMCSSVWGIGANATVPGYGAAGHGWRSDFRLTLNSRYGLGQYSPPNVWMTLAEKWMYAKSTNSRVAIPPNDGVKGLGRIGVDFWHVLHKDSAGSFRGQLCGRYPETYWGQLSLLCCAQWLLSPGPDGPLSTLRAEMLRDSIQAMEARVIIDRALVDKPMRDKLGEELAGRCQTFLSNRHRLVHYAATGQLVNAVAAGADWPAESSRLYDLAAEVSQKLGN